LPTVKINTCDKDWFGRDYVFYDQNGNPMNILYDEELDTYRGKLYFPENSSDTFKTLEISTFERIRGFEYQQYNLATGSTSGVDELFTNKFQLFNTEGIELVGNTFSVDVTKIEPVNDRSDFYSKWVYGSKIDLVFSPGTEIKFNRSIFSINSNETYTVINTKKDAILIITNMDNKTFNSSIGGVINDINQYENLSVNGINAIKIYNYVDSDFRNNFPEWSEPSFYNQIFNDQKLSIVNSVNDNNGVYTVKNKSLGDNYYSNFKILISDFDGDLTIRVKNKTSNFNVYKGLIKFEPGYMILDSDIPPLILPGTKFQVPSSTLNNKTLTIDNISMFNNITTTYYFDGDGTLSNASQVVYEGNIYHCIQSYTQSATQSITPLNTSYWVKSTFVPIKEKLISESVNGNIFLENNQIDLPYTYDNNLTSRVNLAKAFEEHRESLDIIGSTPYLDPLGEYGIIKSK